MVEKIIVTPTSVRGYGNVLEVKASDVYYEYNAILEAGTDPSYGDVVIMEYGEGTRVAASIGLSVSGTEYLVGDTILLTGTALTSDDRPVNAVYIMFYDGDSLLGTVGTGLDGLAEYSYTFSSSGEHNFKAVSGSLESDSVSVNVERQETHISVED